MKIQPSRRVRFLVFLVGAVTCCARSAVAQSPQGLSADEAAKRLQWLKSTEASAPPQPTPAVAPKKRFSETRAPIIRFNDAATESGAGSNTAAEKTPPSSPAKNAHVAESKPAEPPVKNTPAPESKTAGSHHGTPASAKVAETHAAETQAKATPAATTTKSTASKTTTASTKGASDAAKPTETPRPSEATTSGKKIAENHAAEAPAKATPAPKPSPVAAKSDGTNGTKHIAETHAADTQAKTTPAPKPSPLASKSDSASGAKRIADTKTNGATAATTPAPKPTVAPAHPESTTNSKRVAEAKPSTPAPALTPTPKPTVVATTKRAPEPPRIAQATPTPTPAPATKYYTYNTRAERGASRYPWKTQIVTTVFWIGEPVGGNNFTPNCSSSWDANWTRSYGGYDNPKPEARRNFLPANFTPRQNPFYVALPYNDVTRGTTKPEARVVIPWFRTAFQREGQSVCRDRWIAVRNRAGQVAFAQWSDCGPFRTDHWQYVFGMERPRPNLNQGAGLDVSPAMRDYLGLQSTDVTDWRFVEESEVPSGPWALYGDNNPLALRRSHLTKTASKSEVESREVVIRERAF